MIVGSFSRNYAEKSLRRMLSPSLTMKTRTWKQTEELNLIISYETNQKKYLYSTFIDNMRSINIVKLVLFNQNKYYTMKTV
jgi:hypothetical protein